MNLNKKNIIALFVIAFIISACKKDSGENDVSLNIGRIRGIECRNDVGDKYAILGNPDIKLKDKTPGQYNYSIITFPNPNYSQYISLFPSTMEIFIESYLPIHSAHLWVERVNYNENLESTSHYLGSEFIKTNAHLIDINPLGLVVGYNQLAMNVSSISPGYYRLYLQINDELLYDNLAININPF